MWWAFPGIAFDLDATSETRCRQREPAPDRFEDLYVLAAFNAYNRRSGWPHCYDTLAEATIRSDADFVLLGPDAEADTSMRFVAHEVIATIPRRGGDIRVLKRLDATRPHFRTSYAEAWWAHAADLAPAERRVIARSMLMTAVLEGEWARVEELIERVPVLRRTDLPDRNIYWIGGYASLAEWADHLLRDRMEPNAHRREP